MSMEWDPENPPAVVIDHGSGVMKAGFGIASESTMRPQLINSFVGRPKYSRSMIGATRRSILVGRRCTRMMGILKLSYPISGEAVTSWDDLEHLWNDVYEDRLRANPSSHPVLMTEPPLAPMKNRLKRAEIFFENFRVPSMCLQLPQMLALYASGHTTGLVVDSGDTMTEAVPIYEGKYNPSAVCRIPVAGRHVTKYLAKLLNEQGYKFHTSAEMEVAKTKSGSN
mmetsp:Transcript_39249/g.63901  ORF Transcript_39249/g.63901 Transcript_39249/m.63901 type:complete len:225 (+) Transcript_39249:343-1017(+)